jgi:hypothetical protein
MSRLFTLILALALTTLVFVSFSVSATNSTINIGANDNNSRYPIGLDPSANGTSFPNFQTGGTYQQVYAKTAFSGPVTITQIAFASHELTSNPGIATYNFDVSLGSTAAAPNALSTNLAANRGAQLAPVFSGPLTANITDGAQFDVVLDITPFTYDPANGNLLLEINFNAPVQFSGGSLLYFRAGTDSRTSRAANPSGLAGGAFTDNFGLLTRFTTQTNTAPDAHDDAATINEDSGANSISVLANDTDPDNDTLTITAVTQGAHGLTTITVGGSGLTYTPAAHFSGSDVFTYTISDGHGGTDTASVNVTINAVNDSPTFTKGADQTINEDAAAQTVNGWATNISAGEGESGQTLDFIVTNDNNQLFSAQPAVAANGTLTYKSAPNAFGVATVSVKLHDNGGGTDTSATQTFTITVKPRADLPSVTPANTIVNTQTTSGLVITRNPVDGPEVTHFRFFSVTNGRLFKQDGVTEIPSGGVITAAEGQAGLKFTPDPDLYSPQSFFLFTVLAGVGPEPENFTPNFLSVGIGVTCTEAQVFVVSNSNDSGPGSLRDVLSNACSGGKVTFDMSPGHVTSPITLTSGELAVGQEQTIAGPTDTSLVISGNDSSRVFNINWWQANVKISDLTITGGKANTGAGILSNGNLTIKNSTLTGNHAEGLNGLNGSGGALYAESGSLLITNSTISGNTAQGYGGGLWNQTNNATLINVTVTNNRADSNGDGLEFAGGIIQLGNQMNLRNSIVARNFKGTGNTPSDLTGQSSEPYAAISRNNLIGVNDISTGLDGNINLLGSLASPIDPLLGVLANNGGPTKTHLLLSGSPASKAGVNTVEGGNTTVLESDQRGFSRASSGPIDIGAVEISYAISATAGTPQSATIGSAFAVPLQAIVTEAGVPQSGVLVTFAAPANGASGSFSGNATVATDSNGVATAPAFTANSIVGGPYNVTASLAGGSSSATFALTNTAGTAQVTLGNLLQTFDGNPKSASVTSNPAGLNIAVTYNGSAQAPTNAGTYAAIATVNDPSFIGQAIGNLIIQPANQQITFGALANKKFHDADFNTSATASSNLAVSFSASGNCTIAGTHVHLTGAGACTITAAQDGSANYNPAAPVARTFSIGKADQQITFAALADKKVGDADFNLDATASSNLAVALTATGNCALNGSQVHLTGAGLCTVTASQDGNADFNAATPVARTFAIAKADQQITFDALAHRTVGDADFNLTATASSNLAVAFFAVGNCTVAGTLVHPTGAGQCSITASQDGNADYNSAGPVARTFTIGKADQQITFTAPAEKKFGDADFDVDANASSKLTVGLTATGNCSVSGTRVHLTGAGQCTITASQDGNADYNSATPVARTIAISKADQQITFEALANKTVGDADFNLTATASSGLAVSFAANGNCTLNGAQVHLTGAGACTVTASQDGDSNYNAAPAVARPITINKADQQITFAALADKRVGDADFNVEAKASSNLSVGLTATGNCTLSGSAVHLTGAGQCTITASQDGNSDYSPAASVARTFSIGKADQQITFDALSNKTLGDADFSVSATVSSGLAVSLAATGNCTIAGTPVHLTGAGACTVTASQDGNADYNPADAVARTFSIAKADQQITFEALADKKVGDADFAVNATASSNLPVQLSADGNCTMTGSQIHLIEPGKCTITASQDGDADYNPATAVSRAFAIAGEVNNQTLIGIESPSYHVTERVGAVQIKVTRTGDTSGATTVDYVTDDTGTATDCAKFNGLASSRCDFNTAVGTLKFAPGETEKTFDVLINRDSYVESPFETFTVKLSNPMAGAALGTNSTATVQVDDVSGGLSPDFNVVDDSRTFVRQQYHDFLNREPDVAGLNFWADNIDQCDDPARRPADQTVAQCKQVMRINTSAAFFLSIEFAQTGGLVQAFYAAAFDRPKSLPSYLEFIRDTQAVGRGVVMGEGDWQQKLNENREAFMKDFVMRPEFVGLYPTVDSPNAYVNKLYLHAVGRQPTAGELEEAVNEFGGSPSADDASARARVLLRVTRAQDIAGEVHRRSFVQMQYIGYLRRNANELPDTNFDGYDFWLQKLTQFKGDFIEAEMVKAFIESGEYRARFGP